MSTLGRDPLQEPSDTGESDWSWLAGVLDVEDANQEPGESRYAFRIGTWWFLVPLDRQAEVTPRQTCSRLPFTRTWCLGLTNHRGDLVPVYDLGAMIEEERGRGDGRYFLMLGRREARAGLCIDEIRSLRIPEEAHFVPLYPMRHFPDDFDCRGIRLEGTFFAEVDFTELLGILTERALLFGADDPSREGE